MEEIIKYINEHPLELYIAILLAIIAAVIIEFVSHPFKNFKENRKRNKALFYYFGRSSDLKPYDLLRTRGTEYLNFNEKYFNRDIDNSIKECIENFINTENKNHMLILGSPLAGKTRSVYQSLKNINKIINIAYPKHHVNDIIYLQEQINLISKKKRIIILDDINLYNEIKLLIPSIIKNSLIIATCRSGDEFNQLKQTLENEINLFKIIKIDKIEKENCGNVAKELNLEIPKHFDGNIGSLFMDLEAMKTRYNSLSNVEQEIMQIIKLLNFAGLYYDKEDYYIDHIKLVGKIFELNLSKLGWDNNLKKLEAKELLISFKKDKISVDEAYLDFIDDSNFDKHDFLKNIINVLDDYNALLLIGKKIQRYFNLITNYMSPELSVSALTKAINLKNDLYEAYILRGNAYSHLNRFEDAMNDLDKCSSLRPHYPDIYYVKGLINYRLKRFNEAIKNFNIAIELESDSQILYRYYDGRGGAYMRLKKYDEAMIEFKKAISINPNRGEFYNNLGWIYFIKSNLEKAIELFLKSIELFYKVYENSSYIQIDSYIGLIISYYKKGCLDKTKQYLDKVISIYPFLKDGMEGLNQYEKKEMLIYPEEIKIILKIIFDEVK